MFQYKNLLLLNPPQITRKGIQYCNDWQKRKSIFFFIIYTQEHFQIWWNIFANDVDIKWIYICLFQNGLLDLLIQKGSFSYLTKFMACTLPCSLTGLKILEKYLLRGSKSFNLMVVVGLYCWGEEFCLGGVVSWNFARKLKNILIKRVFLE